MKTLRDVDVALLPIGGTYAMDIPEAVKSRAPKIVIPMHFFKADPQEFKNKVEPISDIKVLLLQMGESYKLK